jgi:hypothetical protein
MATKLENGSGGPDWKTHLRLSLNHPPAAHDRPQFLRDILKLLGTPRTLEGQRARQALLACLWTHDEKRGCEVKKGDLFPFLLFAAMYPNAPSEIDRAINRMVIAAAERL